MCTSSEEFKKTESIEVYQRNRGSCERRRMIEERVRQKWSISRRKKECTKIAPQILVKLQPTFEETILGTQFIWKKEV